MAIKCSKRTTNITKAMKCTKIIHSHVFQKYTKIGILGMQKYTNHLATLVSERRVSLRNVGSISTISLVGGYHGCQTIKQGCGESRWEGFDEKNLHL
jgi:hypothetical protein